MESIGEFTRKTFASLKIRNYRLYLIGQGMSLCGNWMQTVAMGWLVLELTHSGTQLGTVLAALYLPQLVGGPFAGSIVDRFEKRRILYVTQSVLGILALSISILVWNDLTQMWMMYLFALGIGLMNMVDQPTRQTFVHEMVGRDHLRNAVTLNSTTANLARAIGPTVAGALIAGLGLAFCFFINALSFLAVLAMLARMNAGEFHVEPREQKPAHLLESFRYAARMPLIRDILIVMALIGTLSYEFQVSLPLLARQTFEGDAASYAALLSIMGLGSVVGGLLAASRQKVAVRELVLFIFLFGVSICLTALAPSLPFAILGMFFVGFFSINLSSVGNTMVQLESEGSMRGRVMSLWSMALFGSTLIGGPIVGYVGEHAGARFGLALGGIAALLAAFYAALMLLEKDQLLTIPAFIKMKSEETDIEEVNRT